MGDKKCGYHNDKVFEDEILSGVITPELFKKLTVREEVISGLLIQSDEKQATIDKLVEGLKETVEFSEKCFKRDNEDETAKHIYTINFNLYKYLINSVKDQRIKESDDE